ncbi:MAG: hypothetical protein JWM78_2002 [Verrucomicrobiaceae bacterium]|nr:hypothetical protein [Verrucomicrobiaceae bacterium]
MRRVAVVAVLVSALVGVVGAESVIKAKNSSLPKGSVVVEEVETVMVEATALKAVDSIANASQTVRGTSYAMY